MMTMMDGNTYFTSLRELKPKIYAFGEQVTNVVDFPLFKPHVNAAAMTYELAHEEKYHDIMTAMSSLTHERVNRFVHIHQSHQDLVNKVRMMRLLGQKTGTCWQRCVGLDALNANYVVSYNIDRKHRGTNYHERVKEYIKFVQVNDLMIAGAMSDTKGDRSLRPHQQPSPDVYVHVTEKCEDGIIVRGAKAHITGAINSHEILAMPTRTMGPNDKDFAVSFAVPIDTEGVILIFGRQTNDTRRLNSEIDAGNAKYGIVGGEALIIFDDVFVPWERVFMCGEEDFSFELVETFAGYHRQNYGGCKVGLADVVTGAAQWIAEANGVEKTSNIRNTIAEMVHLAETCWSCSLACSYEGHKTPSGAYVPHPLLANIVKLNITRFTYEWMRLAQVVTGGLIITLPSEKDYTHHEVGKYMEWALGAKDGIRTEDKIRMVRLIENMAVGAGLPEALHGAGSPAAQQIMIARQSGTQEKKGFAEIIAGIKSDPFFARITGMPEDQYFEILKKRK